MENPQDNQSKPEISNTPAWERDVIEKLVMATLTEQTRARRWNIFFKSLLFLYFLMLFGVAMYPKMKDGIEGGEQHTAVVNLIGPIAEDKDVNAAGVVKSLRDAVKDKRTKGIILHSNSPGGSPVQSAYIYDEIRAIKKEHPDMPIYAVVGDICASGCYYIASASDKIFVNQASLIGSIGVLMDGFGFVDTMQKLGVERRLLTAGEHKAMLDPFSPPRQDETDYMNGLLKQVHQQFIDAVKAGRGDRLKETPEIFSGLVWTGQDGIKLGIADAYGNDDYVAKEVIGAKTLVDFTRQQRLLDKIAGRIGSSFAHTITGLAQGVSLR